MQTANKGPRPPSDPLAHPLVSGLLFGGVFVIVFLWRCLWALLSGRAASAFRDPELWRVLWMMLAFSLTSGVSVALLRGRWLRDSTLRHKNLATGLAVGACYAACCTLFFGQDMPPLPRAGLAGFVFAAVTWAVSSGLNEVFA